jgi:hypothetical protein
MQSFEHMTLKHIQINKAEGKEQKTARNHQVAGGSMIF